MASIYRFTSSVLNHYRGHVSPSAAEQAPTQASAGSSKASSCAAKKLLRQHKRMPLISVHCVNAQAAPNVPASPTASKASDRLAALSLRSAQTGGRAAMVTKNVLHLVPEAADTPLDISPGRCLPETRPTPPQSLEHAAALRPRTLRPTRLVRATAQMSLPQAQERAALAMIAQKLRLGLSCMQRDGSPEALLKAMAQVEQSAGKDVHVTSAARSQLVTLLIYLGDFTDGANSVSFFEALQHIEELLAPRPS